MIISDKTTEVKCRRQLSGLPFSQCSQNLTIGIEQLRGDDGELVIYDLMGRKLTDTDNLKSGIYIVNGRKIIVK